MNPAHLFLISLAWLLTFWLGALCGSSVPDKWENPGNVYAPAFVLNLAAGTGILVSLFQLVSRAL